MFAFFNRKSIAKFPRWSKRRKSLYYHAAAPNKLRGVYTKRSSRRDLMPCINNFIKFNRITLFKSTETIRFNGKLFRHLHFREVFELSLKSHAFLFIPCKPNPKTFLYFRCNSNHLSISDNHYASLPLPVDFFITPIPGRWL